MVTLQRVHVGDWKFIVGYEIFEIIMNELRKIAKLISKRGIKNIPLLNLKRDLDQPGLENLLFYNIQDGQFKDDQDASKDIYDAEATDHRYKMLKSRVRQKMLNHLFFMDQEDPNQEKSVILHEDCLKILNLGHLLLLEKDFEIAEKLLNRCYNLASEAEFNEIVVNSLELLKIIFAENSRPLLLQKNIDDIEETRALLTKEKQAENLYLKNLVILKKSFNARQKYLDEVIGDLAEIEKLYNKTRTYNIFNHYYNLFIKYHLISGDFKKVVEFTSKYEQESVSQKLNVNRYDPIANKYYLLYALYRNGDYDQVIELFENSIGKIDICQYWFKFRHVYFSTLMHLSHYTGAMQVALEVVKNKNFNNLEESIKTKWIVSIGFLLFAGIDRAYFRGLQLEGLLNQFPDRNSESLETNMALLVLQLAYKIERGNTDNIESVVKEMTYYVYKHPIAGYSPRSRMFLKLMNIILKCDKDAKTCRKKGRYLYQQLKSTNQYGDAYSDLEILPYEVIWEKFLDIFERRAVVTS